MTAPSPTAAHPAVAAGHPLALRIEADLAAGRLQLPSLPGIAVEVSRVIEQPQSGAPEVGRVLSADPAIAAKLMKAANSPVFRSQTPCDSLTAAIIRLGLNTVKHLVTSISLLSVFDAKGEESKQRMGALWRHSVQVAAIARVLSERVPQLDADQALLAGLLHDVGAVPVITLAGREPALLGGTPLGALIEQLKGRVGGELLAAWNFPAPLVETARFAEVWNRPVAGPPDYCDLVQVAQLHAFMRSGKPDGVPPLATVSAFRKLARHDLTPDTSKAIITEAAESIADIEALLGA